MRRHSTLVRHAVAGRGWQLRKAMGYWLEALIARTSGQYCRHQRNLRSTHGLPTI